MTSGLDRTVLELLKPADHNLQQREEDGKQQCHKVSNKPLLQRNAAKNGR